MKGSCFLLLQWVCAYRSKADGRWEVRCGHEDPQLLQNGRVDTLEGRDGRSWEEGAEEPRGGKMNKVDPLPFPSGHCPEPQAGLGLTVWCLAIDTGLGIWFGITALTQHDPGPLVLS